MDRREFVAALSAGLALALVGCSKASSAASPFTSDPVTTAPPGTPAAPVVAFVPPETTTTEVGGVGPIPGPRPGPAKVISHGPLASNQIALTVDDGTDDATVAGYIDFAIRSGIHLTFCPNGTYGSWTHQAPRLRPLIESGQVQIANHTWAHADLRRLSDAKVKDQINHNEHWIQQTFGITARPWFRPPFGFHDARIDAIAGGLGYTNVLMWNGTFGDSGLIPAATLMGLADQWAKSGTIMLGHANHPTVLGLFDQLEALMASRNLRPVTLDEMFGTSRRHG
ncbi:MAG: polysaccharide deacetylase [Acidimicrobiia bacterium]|nr:polysaccharide deacetylase [Acidimicrobiia bacterium]